MMAKEGRKSSKAQAPAKKASTRRPLPQHHKTDLTGFALLGIGLLLLFGLIAGSGGLLGDAISLGVRYVFGIGSWVVGAVLSFAGVCIVLGKTSSESRRVYEGSSLIFFGILSLLASAPKGDYFDPDAVAASGGYLGALGGWLFSTLFGAGKPLALIFVITAGAVLCLSVPARVAVKELFRKATGKPLPVEAEVVEATGKNLPSAKSAKKPLVINGEVEEDEEEPKGKKRPISAWLQAQLDAAEDERPSKKTPAKINSSPAQDPAPIAAGSGSYTLPPLSLLTEPATKAKRNPTELQKNIEILEGTLEQFGVDANVVEVATGPSLTRYEIQLGPGIRVNKITTLADNIAMSLAAHHVRVEAPIPGKAAIGVEVPNSVRALVTLREMCDSLEFHDSSSKLMICLGKDVAGSPRYADLTTMPHLLIGGATNSGKSIGLATIIMSLIMRRSPKEVRMVMIDPKRVELSLFEGLPHLMYPVVKDVKEAAGVLRAVWREMDKRYDLFSEKQVRNIDGWNAKADPEDKLPYIVVIIDELADLMIQARAEVETSICRLAQLARATGIHLVIATQRPSVDVITGTIKANIASRVAFAVSSHIDSRTILDTGGAEKLLGKGDMLYHPIDALKATRIQGCYVSEKEIEDVCNFWRKQEKPYYVLNPIAIAVEEKEASLAEEESDEYWEEAVRFVVDRGQASTSMLQRKFSIGFQRASRLLDLMEERGVVGPRDGPRPREVLIDIMQVEVLFGRKEFMTPMDPSEYIGDDE